MKTPSITLKVRQGKWYAVQKRVVDFRLRMRFIVDGSHPQEIAVSHPICTVVHERKMHSSCC